MMRLLAIVIFRFVTLVADAACAVATVPPNCNPISFHVYRVPDVVVSAGAVTVDGPFDINEVFNVAIPSFVISSSQTSTAAYEYCSVSTPLLSQRVAAVTALPETVGVNKWYGEAYAEYPEEYLDLFSKNTDDRAFVEDVGVSGFGSYHLTELVLNHVGDSQRRLGSFAAAAFRLGCDPGRSGGRMVGHCAAFREFAR